MPSDQAAPLLQHFIQTYWRRK